ncbi:MAG: hypothetical protein ABEJ83_01820 [Candidatus Nanohaloarchaea archaeon]
MEAIELQQQVEAVGIIDFVKTDKKEKFLEEMKPKIEYKDESDYLHIPEKETDHPLDTQSINSRLRRVEDFPCEETIFEEVKLDIFVESDELITICLYGIPDKDKFERKKEDLSDDIVGNKENLRAGLEALRNSEKNLSKWLRENISSTFFLSNFKNGQVNTTVSLTRQVFGVLIFKNTAVLMICEEISV